MSVSATAPAAVVSSVAFPVLASVAGDLAIGGTGRHVGAILYATLAEVEPLKTAIILRFVRDWWFVLFAVALLVAGLFIERFFCRYLCPLGAAPLLRPRETAPSGQKGDLYASLLEPAQSFSPRHV